MSNKIKEIMAKALEVPIEEITDQSSQENIDTWDSIHHIKMIVLLERGLDITIPDDKVENMVSYKLIKLVVDECTQI